MNTMKVKIKNVMPNPHRDFERNPLSNERVLKFMESIKDNGFWENLIGRKVNGKIQIAYGHHRVEALKRLYGNDYEFDIRIHEYNDVKMYHVMITENDDFGGNSSDTIDEAVAEAKKMLENDLNLAKEYGDIEKSRKGLGFSGKLQIGDKIITRFMQQRKKGEKENRKSSWNLSKVQRSLARMSGFEEGTLSQEAVRELPSETHASEFARAVKKTSLTKKEQTKLAREIKVGDYSKREVGDVVKKADFKKKYPEFKKVKSSTNTKIIKFENHLLSVADKMSPLSDDLKLLTSMTEEVKGIKDGVAYRKVRVLFASIGILQRRINEFLEAMSKEDELTEEIINEVKQLKQ